MPRPDGLIPAPLLAADFGAVLALNAAHEAETAPLDPWRLQNWVDGAFAAFALAGGRDGFLIALDQDCRCYDSPNFRWFAARLTRFVYIDRVVVAPHARGRGLASTLYQALFARMREAGQNLAAGEVNLLPPNPGSDRFHAALGFTEMGRAALSGGKQVRYLTRPVPPT